MFICLKKLSLGHFHVSHERLFPNFDQLGYGKLIKNPVVSCSVRLYATPVAKSFISDMMYLLYLSLCVCVLKELFYGLERLFLCLLSRTLQAVVSSKRPEKRRPQTVTRRSQIPSDPRSSLARLSESRVTDFDFMVQGLFPALRHSN